MAHTNRRVREFPDKAQSKGLRILRKRNAGWHKRWELLASGCVFNERSGFYAKGRDKYIGYAGREND